MPKETAQAAPRRYKLAKGGDGGFIEITGLAFKVTNENVNNPRVIQAILNAERRRNTRIFGVAIVLE